MGDLNLILCDVCYYVDDFRMVLTVPRGCRHAVVQKKVTNVLQSIPRFNSGWNESLE